MSDTPAVIADEQRSFRDYTRTAYLNYAMYVVLDRALPSLADGLKPVQRRILYAMSELGLKNTAKHKKSARTVGDVLGKFHPHGDSACYEAMVLMAQPFSYRYPLIDGQGNWGSMDDPKSFAAMRYTEAKLTTYAKALLDELGSGTVEWMPNFDGSLKEPQTLPVQVPNVLLNGSTGIAVGMATDIPPHNLNEVADACCLLLENSRAELDDVLSFVKGPDLPTGGVLVTPPEEIKALYRAGRGSFRVRASWSQEDSEIVITELPWQVSGSKLLEQLGQMMQAKKLPMIADLRDESDHENPTRLVVVPRSNRVDCEALMLHLFATTDLERSYRVNLNMIGLDGRPSVKPLLPMLKEWLQYRLDVVRRRLEWRLEKVLARLHILDGLLIAFLNIDEVIEIIRTEDDPKAELMARFSLSDTQAEAILEIKLRQLAKLEEMKIRAEQEELAKERDQLQTTLSSDRRMKTLVRKEIREAQSLWGDPRRSELKQVAQAKAMAETDLMSSEPVTIILSDKGWVRSAKGHEVDATALNYRSGDAYCLSTQGKSLYPTVVMDDEGRCFTLTTHQLPSARGHGEPLTKWVNPTSGVGFSALINAESNSRWLMTTDAGYGFVLNFEDMIGRAKAGKSVLTVPDNAQVLPPQPVCSLEETFVALITSQGRMLVFEARQLPVLKRGKGNKLIGIPASAQASREEVVVAVVCFEAGDTLKIQAGKRAMKLKIRDMEHYLSERAKRGHKLPRGFQSVDSLSVEQSDKGEQQ